MKNLGYLLIFIISTSFSCKLFGEELVSNKFMDQLSACADENVKVSTIDSEEVRLQSLIGNKPTIKSIHNVFGNPDVTYKGESSYQSELFYGKISTKVNLVVYELKDGSIRILYVRKQPDGS